ncbi:MAG: ferredoxin [Nitrospirae bacterium]|nr:MAG: ferredoxin [Nitrospirota bacterium]
MIPYVDDEKCVGCGNCVEICPAVFKMNEETGKSEVYDPEACDFANCCEAAEENCPVEAIKLK